MKYATEIEFHDLLIRFGICVRAVWLFGAIMNRTNVGWWYSMVSRLNVYVCIYLICIYWHIAWFSFSALSFSDKFMNWMGFRSYIVPIPFSVVPNSILLSLNSIVLKWPVIYQLRKYSGYIYYQLLCFIDFMYFLVEIVISSTANWYLFLTRNVCDFGCG